MKTNPYLLVSLAAGLLVASLLVACSPQSVSPQTALPVLTQPVEIIPPSPLPPSATIAESTTPSTGALSGSDTPSPAGPTSTPDLVAYQRQASQSISPDGRYAARIVVALPQLPDGTLVGDMYHVQASLVDFQDNSQQVVVDEWRNWGMGYTLSQVLGWSADSQVIYLVESGVPDGCGPVFFEKLSRVEVENGSMAPVEAVVGSSPALSPDGSRLASIGEGKLLVTALDDGDDQSIPFEPPSGESWAGAVVWGPGGERLLFSLNQNPCGPAEERSTSLYAADLASGSARPLLVADPRQLAPLSWPLDDLAQLGDPERQDYWLKISTGQVSQDPSQDVAAARQALFGFFAALQAGNFTEAAGLYGGTYEQLEANNPDIDPQNQAALLENACRFNGFQCLAVYRAVLTSQPAAGEYLIRVTFNQDGQPFVLGPCCGADIAEMPPQAEFVYTVKQDGSGNFKVMDLPVYVP